ncbi:14471_t:CDS:2 [Funneliformis mosseae]|uniref:14471_t:CDS:1 n=1 Tax=Funneliformis mosseae TaxID=27381 RepID=A0A9N9GL70_FUNMO|nr:14471_t:CDS:2 [Funneliformis mosseae]
MATKEKVIQGYDVTLEFLMEAKKKLEDWEEENGGRLNELDKGVEKVKESDKMNEEDLEKERVELENEKKKLEDDKKEWGNKFKKFVGEGNEQIAERKESGCAVHYDRLESNQGKANIMCHRPPEYVGRPVVWFCDIFVQFHQDLKNAEPVPKKYYDIALKLCKEMSKTYPNENARTKAFDDYALIGNREFKNEIGTGHVDPYLQGVYSWLNYWSTDRGDFWRKQCCCPGFIISVAGS